MQPSREKWIRFDENRSFWAKELPEENPALDSDLEVDVAVIGAGYTGLSSAYHIKRLLPDRKVVVFEAKFAGHGASGRNGGMCLNQPSMDYMSMVRPDTHRLTYEATAQSIKELMEIMRSGGYGSHIRMSGSLLVNTTESGSKRSEEYARKAVAMGVPIEYWEAGRIKKEIGTGVYAGGLFDPNAAEANPMMIVCALKTVAEKSGVVVYERSPVLNLRRGRTIQLAVGGGGKVHNVHAKAVVLGTDAYSARLGYFNSSLVVTHTELAVTKPLDDSLFREVGWTSRTPFHDDRLLLYHLGTTEDKRIMIGAGNIEYFFNDGLVYKRDVDRRGRALKKELVRIFPALEGVEFERIWSGPLSFSLDMSQSVGTMGRDGNLFYGAGYAGHGVTLAFLFGKIIGDIYAGRGKTWERMPFFQKPFSSFLPPEPFRYLVVKSYMRYTRMKDSRGRR